MRRLIISLITLVTIQSAFAVDRLSSLPCPILGGELSNSAATSVADIDEERRMENIKEGVRGINLTPEQQYDLNQRLYDEYVAYKFDSAFYYIDKNVKALRASGDK